MALVDWLDGFEHRPRPDAGPMGGEPSKMVLHTTEGNLASAIGALDGRNVWPHFLLDYPTRTKIQAVSLNRAGKSLANKAGGVETNKAGAIQVEIVGFAAHTHEMGDDEVDWYAQSLAPAYFACGIDSTITVPFYGQDAGFTLATPSAPQRMGFAEWSAFNGTCGHQHVPENDHWDPGKFRIDRFLATLRGGGTTPPTTDKEAKPMFFVVTEGKHEGRRLCDSGSRVFHIDGKRAASLKAQGVPGIDITSKEYLGITTWVQRVRQA